MFKCIITIRFRSSEGIIAIAYDILYEKISKAISWVWITTAAEVSQIEFEGIRLKEMKIDRWNLQKVNLMQVGTSITSNLIKTN